MQKNKAVIYIDPASREHDALVVAVNQMHDGVISDSLRRRQPRESGRSYRKCGLCLRHSTHERAVRSSYRARERRGWAPRRHCAAGES